MIQFLLILLGLISNPSSSNNSNCGNDGTSTTVAQQQTEPGDTGGEEIHTPKK